jgi:uncharacterized caspase-like protein
VPAALPAPRQKWALVIGIGKFGDPAIPSLTYTGPDAKAFAATLQDPKSGRFKPGNVHTLTDAQATTRAIKEQLNWLARSAGPDDLVVIYLASHGSPRTMDTAGVSYIITADTDITDQDSLYATALPMVDLGNSVASRVRSTRVAIFIDTCFSGAAAYPSGSASAAIAPGVKSATLSPDMLDRIRQGTGRVILTASSANQQSWESDRLHHGYFTYFLLQALQENNGMMPLSQVYSYVQQHVSNGVLTDWKAHQDPVMSQSDIDEEIVIGAAPSDQG